MAVVEVRRWDHAAVRSSDHAARNLCNSLWRKTEFSVEFRCMCLSNEAIHGNDCTIASSPAIPSEADPGLNADARANCGGED